MNYADLNGRSDTELLRLRTFAIQRGNYELASAISFTLEPAPDPAIEIRGDR